MQEEPDEDNVISEALRTGCFYCKDPEKQFTFSGEGEDKMATCQKCKCEHKAYSYKFRIHVDEEKKVNWKSYQEVQAMQEEAAKDIAECNAS